MKMKIKTSPGIFVALLAALLFGMSTPFAKLIGNNVSPLMLAGLLYAGSGIGLSLCLVVRRLRNKSENERLFPFIKADIIWLIGAILFGGILAPALLMYGLRISTASGTALLLNLEGVFTALLAWFVFKENFDRRIFAGMVLIVAGGVLLSLREATDFNILPFGSLLVIGACFCWGIDNNLTRKISASDALWIACIKGLVAGAVNITLATLNNDSLPDAATIGQISIVGFFGYGLSLVLFVLALRSLGSARTGAYFSFAPFAGAALSLLLIHETPDLYFWLSALLMAGGIWLHITERHEHQHTHEATEHEHDHYHDEHHQHTHDFEWDGKEPHTHPHKHQPMSHSHPHYPDIHHRHKH